MQQKSHYCPEMFGINSCRVQRQTRKQEIMCWGRRWQWFVTWCGYLSTFRKEPKRSGYFTSGRRVRRVLFWSKLEGPPEPLHHHTPTHLPTVRFWNKAFGSTSYLVINVKRPLNIIDVGCDAHKHTHTQSWSTQLSGDWRGGHCCRNLHLHMSNGKQWTPPTCYCSTQSITLVPS